MARRYLSLLLMVVMSTAAWGGEKLTVVYTYAEDSFDRVLQDFARESGFTINPEFKEQSSLKSSILAMMEIGAAPDAIIMPADHIGLHSFIKYSQIDPKDFPARVSQRLWASADSNGKYYGVPLIQGNHLLLFYNKKWVSEPATDWTTIFSQQPEFSAKGVETIAWNFNEVYWFLPFLGAYGGWPLINGQVELNSPAMIAALDFYKTLRIRNLPKPNCNYECTVDLFKKGNLAYTINGDWISKEFHDALGEDLGVAAIPMAEGKKMVPTFTSHVLAFPNEGLASNKRAALMKLAHYLQSPAIQRQLWEKMGAIPVEETAFKHVYQQAPEYVKTTIDLMADTKPLPADKEMTFIWDAIGKGFLRHREGALDAPAAAKYMQQMAERHIHNAKQFADPANTVP